MGRNRKGRQCGGYSSKFERYVLQKSWENQVFKHVNQANLQRRYLHAKEEETENISIQFKRKIRVDFVRSLMDARVRDDHLENIKQKSAESISHQLQTQSHSATFTSLQERCLYEIARSFEYYLSDDEIMQEFFRIMAPWMVTKISVLATAMKTINARNIELLLLQEVEDLTIGYVRNEKSVQKMFAHDKKTWKIDPIISNSVEYWDELDIDDFEFISSDEQISLKSLQLICSSGLSSDFSKRLVEEHPMIEELVIVDSFDGQQGEEIIHHIANLRYLKRLSFSWCTWLTTDLIVSLAYLIRGQRIGEVHPCGSQNKIICYLPNLVELQVSDCFDVTEDYVVALFQELHPHLEFKT